MHPDDLAIAVTAALQDHLGMVVTGWRDVDTGMNSTTVLLEMDGGELVAKWVPARDAVALRRGALVATELAGLGVRSGPPITWGRGKTSFSVGGGEVIVLERVAGAPLTAHERDQDVWGTTLGTVHALTTRPAGRLVDFYAAVGLEDPPPPSEPWISAALTAAEEGVEALSDRRWVLLHTDPAPEAFLRDASGEIGIVDWTGATSGPALYDVASAVMYAGGEAKASRLLEAYSRRSDLPHGVDRAHLRAFLRLRGVVQAVYFARRRERGDLTGVASHEGNVRGLADARRLLRDLGDPAGDRDG